MAWLSIVLTVTFTFLVLWLKIKHPQTIWLGISVIGLFLSLIMAIFLPIAQKSNLNIWNIMILFFTLTIFTVPLFMVGLFIISGLKNIFHKDFNLENVISLLLGISIILYSIIWPILIDFTENQFLDLLHQLISIPIIYFSFILTAYALTNLLNLIHYKPQNIDYYIVLGAGLAEDKVTPVLAERMNKAIELQEIQKSGKIILSGGQGPDELISEAEAMKQYALEQGVDEQILLKEKNSTNTYENIKFSKNIIEKDWNNDSAPRVAIVTSHFHVLRALMQANNLGVESIGFGSRSHFEFSNNAFLREFIAYLSLTYKIHSFLIIFIGIIILHFKF